MKYIVIERKNGTSIYLTKPTVSYFKAKEEYNKIRAKEENRYKNIKIDHYFEKWVKESG